MLSNIYLSQIQYASQIFPAERGWKHRTQHTIPKKSLPSFSETPGSNSGTKTPRSPLSLKSVIMGSPHTFRDLSMKGAPPPPGMTFPGTKPGSVQKLTSAMFTMKTVSGRLNSPPSIASLNAYDSGSPISEAERWAHPVGGWSEFVPN